MISVNDLINTVYIPYNEKAGYIMGSWGQVHTASAQANATREQTKKWGSRWIGKRCWDCSGLFYWVFRLYGQQMYHGSNTMWNKYCVDKGQLYNGERDDNEPLKIGTALFLNKSGNRHHVGIYVGDGNVIQAKGTYYGVVMSRATAWHEWGQLKGVDYTGRVVLDLQALRIGKKGDQVKDLQNKLNSIGFYCGAADGIFGSATKAAVISFQTSSGLYADGIFGEKTKTALDEAIAKKSGSSEVSSYDLSKLSYQDLKKLASLLEQAMQILTKAGLSK